MEEKKREKGKEVMEWTKPEDFFLTKRRTREQEEKERKKRRNRRIRLRK